jgi:hypothetical protein
LFISCDEVLSKLNITFGRVRDVHFKLVQEKTSVPYFCASFDFSSSPSIKKKREDDHRGATSQSQSADKSDRSLAHTIPDLLVSDLRLLDFTLFTTL